jgi:hypothetical protein
MNVVVLTNFLCPNFLNQAKIQLERELTQEIKANFPTPLKSTSTPPRIRRFFLDSDLRGVSIKECTRLLGKALPHVVVVMLAEVVPLFAVLLSFHWFSEWVFIFLFFSI